MMRKLHLLFLLMVAMGVQAQEKGMKMELWPNGAMVASNDKESGNEEHRYEPDYPQHNLCSQRMTRLFFCQPLHRVQRYNIIFKKQKFKGNFYNDGQIWKNMCTFVPF